jgi:hypothetical protein
MDALGEEIERVAAFVAAYTLNSQDLIEIYPRGFGVQHYYLYRSDLRVLLARVADLEAENERLRELLRAAASSGRTRGSSEARFYPAAPPDPAHDDDPPTAGDTGGTQ